MSNVYLWNFARIDRIFSEEKFKSDECYYRPAEKKKWFSKATEEKIVICGYSYNEVYSFDEFKKEHGSKRYFDENDKIVYYKPYIEFIFSNKSRITVYFENTVDMNHSMIELTEFMVINHKMNNLWLDYKDYKNWEFLTNPSFIERKIN